MAAARIISPVRAAVAVMAAPLLLGAALNVPVVHLGTMQTQVVSVTGNTQALAATNSTSYRTLYSSPTVNVVAGRSYRVALRVPWTSTGSDGNVRVRLLVSGAQQATTVQALAPMSGTIGWADLTFTATASGTTLTVQGRAEVTVGQQSPGLAFQTGTIYFLEA